MTYSTGMMLFLIWCLVMYVAWLFFAGAAKRNEEWDRASREYFDRYEWKLRRKIEQNGQRARWGGR